MTKMFCARANPPASIKRPFHAHPSRIRNLIELHAASPVGRVVESAPIARARPAFTGPDHERPRYSAHDLRRWLREHLHPHPGAAWRAHAALGVPDRGFRP